jgi:hypothetical protein
MAIQLTEYQDLLEELGEQAGEVLEATWHEAVRVFSPRGLEAYLKGAAGLKSLGRGTDLVISFIESAPLVAKEIGEQAVPELLSTAIQMYSRTSAEVLSLVFSTSSTAANRLGELDLFKAYLSLLNNLVAKAPRAIRPFLENLDVLLGQLTLGGLRRWIAWGISAYRNDFDAQADYFGLNSEQSKAVLQQEQRGVLFVNVQRRLNMYLRSLWGRDFFIRPTSGDFETREGYRPYIEHYFIHLPDAFDDYTPEGLDPDSETTVSGMDVYRASSAHAAAHIVFSHYDTEAEELSNLQKLMIGVIEDARIERLAIQSFPGMKQLWIKLLPADPALNDGLQPILDRLARALLDENYVDSHPLIKQARDAMAAAEARLQEPELAREIGLQLAEQVIALDITLNSRIDKYSTPYRDDNRCLWQSPDYREEGHELLPGETEQVRKYVSIMEMINEVEVENAGDDAQEIWVLETELFPYEDEGESYNDREGKEPISSPIHYHEWDYQTQLERPNWVTLLEKRPKMGDPDDIEEILERHKPVVRRLKQLIEAVQPQGVIRQRKVEDGDDIDLNAAIGAMIDIRRGMQPDPRIGIRTTLQIRDLSVLLLIDLSESTNDPLPGSKSLATPTATLESTLKSINNDSDTDKSDANKSDEVTILDLSREAATLMADAMDKIGDPFAIHGFDSNGRHDVEYYRFKDFDESYDEEVKAHLAGMTGQLSTRMGAAIRHAGTLLNQRASSKKILFILTDGEPADNDETDPQYLRFDTKKAVEELARNGINTFCLTLDPFADQYVSRIFGAKNFLVLDHVSRLPEKLPELYLSLTK